MGNVTSEPTSTPGSLHTPRVGSRGYRRRLLDARIVHISDLAIALAREAAPSRRPPSGGRRRLAGDVRLLPFAVAALSCGIALGQDKAGAPPDRIIAATPMSLAPPAAVLPHGSTAYMITTRNAVNVWSLLAYYWPEATAAASLLVGSIWLWRRTRDVRRRGERYCRRCNQCLTGVCDATCPECGAALTGRLLVIARHPRRPQLTALLFLVAVPVAYAASFRWLPREGRFSEWFNWPSTGLAELAWKQQLTWLSNRACDRWAIVEVDVATGAVRQVIALGEGVSNLVASGDGSEILGLTFRGGVAGWGGPAGVVRMNSRDGRIRKVVTLEQPVTDPSMYLVGYADHAQTAFLISQKTEQLMALDLPKGTISQVRQIAAMDRRVARGVYYPIIVTIAPDHQRLLIAEPDGQFYFRGPSDTLGVRTRTVELWEGVQRSKLAVLGESLPLTAMSASRDGLRLYATVQGRGVVAWDLSRPAEPPWTVAALESPGDAMAISPDDRWLFVAIDEIVGLGMRQESIQVLDLTRLESRARFAVPAGAKVYDLATSADGRHVTALCVFVNGARGRQVMVYDVHRLLTEGVESQAVLPAEALDVDDGESRPNQ